MFRGKAEKMLKLKDVRSAHLQSKSENSSPFKRAPTSAGVTVLHCMESEVYSVSIGLYNVHVGTVQYSIH